MELFPYSNDYLKRILNTGSIDLEEDGKKRSVSFLNSENEIFISDYIFDQSHDILLGNNSSELKFENCQFQKTTTLNASHNTIKAIKFSRCLFNEHLKLQGGFSEIRFENCSEAKKISLYSIIPPAGITFINSSIEDLEFASCANTNGEISILRCPKIALLKFENSVFQKEIKFEESEINSVEIKNCSLHDFLVISTKAIIGKLNFEKALFSKGIKIEKASLLKCDFSKINEIPLLNIQDSFIYDIEVRLSSIRKATISAKEESFIKFKGKLSEGTEIIIVKSKFKTLLLDKIINKGDFELSEVTVEGNRGVFRLQECDLGKMKILKCDFGKAELHYENSSMADIFISQTIFPKKIYSGNHATINYADAQRFFGQLQTVFLKQGDNISHYEFQAREIEAHYHLITLFKKFRIRDFPWINFTKINLFLNKWSNSFGRSWERGVVFTLLIGTLFFNLTINSTPNYDFAIRFNSDMLGPILKFMNPLRHFEIEALLENGDINKKLDLVPISYVWDFMGRIFVAYGYYQTIQAFRRFGRK